MKDAKKVPLQPAPARSAKAPPVAISCRDLTLRFPVYGVDAKSLKKRLAAVTIGGRLGSHAGVTEVQALSNVNLELKAGDRLGLVGHNGAGKTTLLRALSGAYEPDEGQVEVQGRIAALLDLGLGIDASATGYDNIKLRGRIAGLTTREIDARMDEIAEFSGLGPFLAMPVKTYSAGMRGRLAFAAATAVDADVLLMDEWIAVGDSEFQQMAHKRLLKLVERAGILVLASHDLDLIRLYCNKVMRLDGGVASPVTDVRKLEELIAA
jgi:lipopolysaccharide transport system ATP-binding protein